MGSVLDCDFGILLLLLVNRDIFKSLLSVAISPLSFLLLRFITFIIHSHTFLDTLKESHMPTMEPREPSFRILIKCSWSGARIPVPSQDISLKTTISQIITLISSQLPPLFTKSIAWDEPQPFILYLRTTVLKRDWDVTTINDVLGNDLMAGNILFTLSLPDSNPDSLTGVEVPREDGKECDEEPMDVDDTESKIIETSLTATTKTSRPSKALQNILKSNFDTESKEFLQTCLKIIDNMLSRPNDQQVRSLKLNNPVVKKKILSKTGALEFLFSIGFEEKTSSSAVGFDFDQSSSRIVTKPEVIAMNPMREDSAVLINIRNEISTLLSKELKVDEKTIRPMPRLPEPKSSYTTKSSNLTFDPFRSSSFSVQAAAVGAPNPNSIVPDGSSTKSTTEKKLDMLKQKQIQLEQTFQSLQDRNIVAYLPGDVGPIVTVNSPGDVILDSKGDGALIASQLKKRMEDKQKEDAGFTTKAMRDLERMKKQKVYSHTQLKIYFSDGSRIEAKFLPNETVAAVRNIVKSTFLPQHQAHFDFDLYVSPPRKILSESKSLREEGLVPAAKLHVSWKIGFDKSPVSGSSPGSFIQQHFFISSSSSSGNEFPNSVSIGGEADLNEKMPDRSVSDVAAREEEIMQRMLGKRKGLLGRSGKGSSSSMNNSIQDLGKPKWFKG